MSGDKSHIIIVVSHNIPESAYQSSNAASWQQVDFEDSLTQMKSNFILVTMKYDLCICTTHHDSSHSSQHNIYTTTIKVNIASFNHKN